MIDMFNKKIVNTISKRGKPIEMNKFLIEWRFIHILLYDFRLAPIDLCELTMLE